MDKMTSVLGYRLLPSPSYRQILFNRTFGTHCNSNAVTFVFQYDYNKDLCSNLFTSGKGRSSRSAAAAGNWVLLDNKSIKEQSSQLTSGSSITNIARIHRVGEGDVN